MSGVGSVVLVGLPGVGKSTVGRILADRLAFDFVDVDEEIEASGTAISDFFDEGREADFRNLEREVVASALRSESVVVSPGSGWASEPGNLEAVSSVSTLYLRASLDTVLSRLSVSPVDRPLLREDREARLRKLMEVRGSYFARCSVTVDTDGRSPAAVVDACVAALIPRAP